MPTYTGISSEAFKHPLDHQAEEALRSLPGFDFISRKFVEFFVERPQLVYLMGNTIQVGPRQYSTIYHMFHRVRAGFGYLSRTSTVCPYKIPARIAKRWGKSILL